MPTCPEEWVLDHDKIWELTTIAAPSETELDEILNKALKLKGLDQLDVAKLLNIKENSQIQKLLETAKIIKEKIYGRRMVIFAPLYTGNVCSNDCQYCGFRKSNHSLKRAVLTMDQITQEIEVLLRDGHKRILMLCGESKANTLDYFIEAIQTAYKARWNGQNIRRINVEIAPMSTKDFIRLKTANIGTYVVFQETYDPVLYKKYHLSGPKADYDYRRNVMHRAMAGGIDDVGLGVLFGLGDYRFEVLSMIAHAEALEQLCGCGPHTVSVPRIEPAEGTPLTEHIPYQVSDDNFRKIVAILRIALPYTGIILSTRENEYVRNELFNYGISQVSAGSRTNPGAYTEGDGKSGSQFSLGDHRSLEEVVESLVDKEFIPSFCTGCYRKGRVGHDFMDLAKPGLIQQFCMPNGIFTFQEYLEDFASVPLKQKGKALIDKLVTQMGNRELQTLVKDSLKTIENGERDVYL